MGTPLASVFVEGRVDTHLMGEDIRRGLSSPTIATSASSAGAKTGATFGSKFSTGVVETGRKGTTGLFEQAEKGAVTSGLGIGRRAGLSITRGLGDYAKLAGATVAGYFAAEKVKEFFTASVDGAETLEKQEKLTAQAIASTGGVANVTAEDIDTLTKSIESHSSASQLDIRSAETLLLRFTAVRDEVGKGNDIYNRAVQMAANLSTNGRSLSSSMLVLGKALNAPTTGLSALTRVGVQFTDQQKVQITTLVQSGNLLDAQKLILDSLAQKYGGAAAAAATPIDHLKQSFTDLEIETGQKLLPVLNEGAGLIVTLGGDAATLAHLVGEVPAPIRDVALAMLAFKAASSLGVFSAIASGWDTVRIKALLTGDAIATADRRMLLARGGAVALGAGLGILSEHASGTAQDLEQIGSAAAIGFGVGGPWGAAIGAGIGLLTHLGSATKITTTSIDSLRDSFNQTTGAITEDTRALVANTLEQNGTLDAARKAGLNLQLVEQAALGNARAQELLRQEYAALVPASDQASHSFAATNIILGESTSATFDASQANGEYAQNAKKVLDAVGAEAGAVRGAKSAWDLIKSALGGATDAQKTNKSATDATTAAVKQQTYAQELLNNVFSGRESSLANLTLQIESSRSALKKLGDVEVSNTGVINTNTKAGATLAQNLVQIAQAASQVTGSHAVMAHAVNIGRDAIYAAARAAGVGVQDAHALTNALLDVPDIKPHVDVDTSAGMATAARFRTYLQGLLDNIPDEQVDVNLSAQTSKVLNELGSGVFTGAAGGPITGGTPGRDSVPALLMPGEHVLTAHEVAQMGGHEAVFALRRMIHNGSIPTFGVGGPVVDVNTMSSGASSAVSGVEGLFNHLISGVDAALSRQVAQAIQHAAEAARKAAAAAGGGSTYQGSGGAWGAIHSAANQFGWGSGGEWADLVKIINSESGGNPNAQNPTSTAYGIYQFLDSTWASVGGHKTSDPYLQSIYGDRYIKQRYGDPIGAWGFHVAHGWYDRGGGLAPGMTLAMNGTGKVETITPANDMADAIRELRGIRSALESHGIKVKTMPPLDGPVTALAQRVYDANRGWQQR